jgi:hypothetical protein
VIPAGDRRELLRRGEPVSPRTLEGLAFRGEALDLHPAVERLTWRWFQKVFWREPGTGLLLGWNVRLHQDGPDAPSRPLERGGEPDCRWFFEVSPTRGLGGLDTVMVDYARRSGRWDPMRWIKDPLVHVTPDLLLGVSWLVVRGRVLPTPTWFTLRPEHEVRHVPAALRRAP